MIALTTRINLIVATTWRGAAKSGPCFITREHNKNGSNNMRTYIELRNGGGVLDWRVIIDPEDATVEWIAEKVREITWNGIDVGDTINVYQSDKDAHELKYR
jgi:hypothetical protein